MFTTHIHPVPPHGPRDGARPAATPLARRVLARLSRRPHRPRLRLVSADDTSAASQVVTVD